jgi:hypothetical protein
MPTIFLFPFPFGKGLGVRFLASLAILAFRTSTNPNLTSPVRLGEYLVLDG